MLKLNLGCGIFYKTGYVNIDLEEKEIADKLHDVSLLPYDDNSIDLIEASHILEHFDIIHLPYILAEWYRVLQPGGDLIIETPNLSKSVKKLRFRNYNNQISTLKFLFGVDFSNNIHKMGFTSSFLRKTLAKTGFSKIRKNKQESYRDKEGLRIRALKPDKIDIFEKKHFISILRTRIYSSLEKPETQFLDTIEINCITNLYRLPNRLEEFFSFENIVFYCASFITIKPVLGYIFLSMFPEKIIKKINKNAIDFFVEIEFHSLLMTNWLKRKKGPFSLMHSITSFYSHWVNKIQMSLSEDIDYEKMFSYLVSLDKETVDFFSFDSVNLLSSRLENQGIKEFSKSKFEEASKLFISSLRANPTNVVSNLNLARLSRKTNENPKEALNYYTISKKHMPIRKERKFIKKEIDEMRKQKDVEIQPFQYRF